MRTDTIIQKDEAFSYMEMTLFAIRPTSIASVVEMSSSKTVYPAFDANSMMDLRVTPGKIVPFSGGVLIVLPFTENMLQEDTSSMYVSVLAST